MSGRMHWNGEKVEAEKLVKIVQAKDKARTRYEVDTRYKDTRH